MEIHSPMVQSDQKISKKELFSYFSYGVGQCISFGLVGTFILYFYTDILGISAIAASTIFLIARAWDAIIDPLIGGVMDTLNSKHGKFRPYMLYTPFIIILVTVFCFLPLDLSPTGKIIYAGITYILWGMVYAVSDVPFWSMTSVMSQDKKERSKLVTFANLGIVVGMGIPTLLFNPIAEWIGKGNTEDGYTFTVVILMLISLPLMIIGFKNTKERVKHSGEKIKLIDVFKVVKTNKHLFVILATFLCSTFMNIATGLYVYFFKYNLGSASLMSIFGVISVFSGLGFLLLPFLISKFKKKHIFMSVALIDILIRVVFFFIGYENTLVVFIFLAIVTCLHSLTTPIISAMIVDTIEYSEWRTGRRCEAITFSGQTFTGKLSIAIAGGLTGIVLNTVGYLPGQAQSSQTLSGLFFCIVLIPALGSVLRLVCMSFYTFTEDKHEAIVEELNSRSMFKSKQQIL
ncbi:MFS transporter [Priestia megaterium]|uniref:MFS transporter n=1 Tax=Priestia megaterium TaxID=1404 RepID=UPI002FDFEF2F